MGDQARSNEGATVARRRTSSRGLVGQTGVDQPRRSLGEALRVSRPISWGRWARGGAERRGEARRGEVTRRDATPSTVLVLSVINTDRCKTERYALRVSRPLPRRSRHAEAKGRSAVPRTETERAREERSVARNVVSQRTSAIASRGRAAENPEGITLASRRGVVVETRTRSQRTEYARNCRPGWCEPDREQGLSRAHTCPRRIRRPYG